ncbi:uncharacterized protein JCM10292_004508 [Rhodotorula paludigena]|uniref:uncharacterized protein n=1 Tax=Rhodotorula paludigena TaxID=86838 RepID=UPI00317B6709
MTASERAGRAVARVRLAVPPPLCLHRSLPSPRHRPRTTASRYSSSSAPRTYLYDLDVHGQLFLSSAKHRNVATAFRDARFLDVFVARLRRNDAVGDGEAQQLRKDGYEFVSECMGEMNYLRPDSDGSGLVYTSLEGEELRYAGTLARPFEPDALRVDPHTGYLFHPSPPLRRKVDRYGPYSLLRSSLVLEHLSSSLELDDKLGGSFEWAGRRREIRLLEEGDVWRSPRR